MHIGPRVTAQNRDSLTHVAGTIVAIEKLHGRGTGANITIGEARAVFYCPSNLWQELASRLAVGMDINIHARSLAAAGRADLMRVHAADVSEAA